MNPILTEIDMLKNTLRSLRPLSKAELQRLRDLSLKQPTTPMPLKATHLRCAKRPSSCRRALPLPKSPCATISMPSVLRMLSITLSI